MYELNESDSDNPVVILPSVFSPTTKELKKQLKHEYRRRCYKYDYSGTLSQYIKDCQAHEIYSTAISKVDAGVFIMYNYLLLVPRIGEVGEMWGWEDSRVIRLEYGDISTLNHIITSISEVKA